MSRQSRPVAHAPAAVVLNTHYSGLGIARDLGPLGVRVIGLTAYACFPGNRSRWIDYRPAADCVSEPARLLQQLLDLSAELGERAVLFPTRDHDVQFINAWRRPLESAYRIPFSVPAIVERILNKDELFGIARRTGVAVPDGVTLHHPDEVDRAAGLRYPCICKPLYASQWRREGIWQAVGMRKAVRVDTFEQFVGLYRRFAHLDPVVTVQQWIPGGDEHLQVFGSYRARNGRIDAFFTARKRLQYPESAGTGIVLEALPLPELETPSRELLSALDYFGVSEIEYKRDARDGRLYLIEINPRHWDQHRLGTAVGVSVSAAAYFDAIGEHWPPARQAAERVSWIAETEVAAQLWRCLRGRASWSRTLRALGRRRVYAVLDAADPRPALALLGLRGRAPERASNKGTTA